MARMSRGNPLVNFRLNSRKITLLQIMADERHTTVSEILRTLVEEELELWGYTDEKYKALEGQIEMQELE